MYFKTSLVETMQDKDKLRLSIFVEKTTHHVFKDFLLKMVAFFKKKGGRIYRVASVRGKSLHICLP